MNYNAQTTVREIAIGVPSSVRVFETLGIDYCCGGTRTLGEACSRVEIPLERVLEILAGAAESKPAEDPAGWADAPLAGLIAHIVRKHHGYVRQETPRIHSLLAKVAGKHGENHPEVGQIGELFHALGQELSTHMLKEEQILFPYIQGMESALQKETPRPASCFGTVRAPIANMMADHDDAGALLTRMRELSSGYTPPPEACPTYHALYQALEDFERDLQQHVHLENNLLFPRAVEMESASRVPARV